MLKGGEKAFWKVFLLVSVRVIISSYQLIGTKVKIIFVQLSLD